MSVTEFSIRRYNLEGARMERVFAVSNLHEVVTSWTDGTADAGTEYGYFIRAKNNRGFGTESSGAYTDD